MSLIVAKFQSNSYPQKNKTTFVLALMVLFLVMFDNLVQYISPLLISEQGYSTTIIGLIIGSSSLAGALFDFVLSRFFKNIDFRRIFLIVLIICLFFPLLLMSAKIIWLWFLAMAIWGIYFDLLDFGIFDYIGRHTKKEDHSSNFGIIQIFKALAGILSPLIVGLVIVEKVDWRSFSLAWFFIILAFIFFIIVLVLYKRHPLEIKQTKHLKKRTAWLELRLWKIIAVKLWPALLITFFLFVLDAFFWTLAPLYGRSASIEHFGGLLLSAYALPVLLLGWFVGPITKKYGKKKTAFVSLLLGSLGLSLFNVLPGDAAVIAIVFLSSCFISLAMPSINGAYADYISEAPLLEGEIEGLENFAFNIGYFVGPIFAGLLADFFDIKIAFSLLGFLGVVLSIYLLQKASRPITLKISSKMIK